LLITNLGVMGVVLIGIGIFGKWFLDRLDDEKVCRNEERKAERGEREAMTKGFLDALNDQNVLISNHIDHMTEGDKEQREEFRRTQDGLERLISSVDFLCREIRADREKCNG